jgi:hypothetical protein
MKDDAQTLIAYSREHQRVCPQPQRWQALWEMLPDRRQVDGGWSPPLPLILVLGTMHRTLKRCSGSRNILNGQKSTARSLRLRPSYAALTSQTGIILATDVRETLDFVSSGARSGTRYSPISPFIGVPARRCRFGYRPLSSASWTLVISLRSRAWRWSASASCRWPTSESREPSPPRGRDDKPSSYRGRPS